MPWGMVDDGHYDHSKVMDLPREIRKPRFGGHTIERQHVGDGLWRYRLVVEQRRAA